MEIFWWNLRVFSPGPPKIDLSKMERKQGWNTGPIVLQNYSLLCYKLLFVLIRFSLFLHLFVFSFYLRAVVKVTCRFFFYFFSLFFAKWMCVMYAIMAFFFFNWLLLGFYLFLFLCFNLFFNWA